MARQVVEWQLNHDTTFQVPLQHLHAIKEFAITLQEYDRCVVYFNENPRTIVNWAYSCIFYTNIPVMRHVLYEPWILYLS